MVTTLIRADVFERFSCSRIFISNECGNLLDLEAKMRKLIGA